MGLQGRSRQLNDILPKIVDFIQRASKLDIHEKAHAKDGEDEHDQEQEQTNVEEGGHRHGQRKQECANAAGTFHQPQDTADFCDTHNTEQSWGHEVFFYQVTQQNS